MTKASTILSELKKLQKLCNENPFKHNDARGDFFRLVADVLDNFYKGYIAIELAEFINQEKIRFSPELVSYEENINRFVQIIKDPILENSFLNNLNRRVIVDVWSAFEITITSIAEAIFMPVEKDKLLMKDYYEVLNVLKTCNVDENTKSKLNEKLAKKHLSHVPINRKYNKILKKIEANYKRNLKDDRGFLDFWGKLRNTMHGNYIYNGVDFEYEFKEYHFIFESGKVVKNNNFEDSLHLIIGLTNEIVLIFTEVIKNLDEFDFIPYLDPEVEDF